MFLVGLDVVRKALHTFCESSKLVIEIDLLIDVVKCVLTESHKRATCSKSLAM